MLVGQKYIACMLDKMYKLFFNFEQTGKLINH